MLLNYHIIAGLLTGSPNTKVIRSQYFIHPATGGNMSIDLSVDMKMVAGQFVYVTACQSSGIVQEGMPTFSYFSEHRIY